MKGWKKLNFGFQCFARVTVISSDNKLDMNIVC